MRAASAQVASRRMGARLALAAALGAGGLAAVATASGDDTTRALRRANLVNVQRIDPAIRVDVRYATRDNFTGRRLPGYCKPWAHMKRRPARALALVQRDLEARGLGLEVFDGYRPARASRAMVRWAYGPGAGTS